MDRVDLGQRLREARRRSGVKVADVAAAVGVTTQALYMWERGERNAQIEELECVAAAVGHRLRVQLEPADRDTVDVAVPPDVADTMARIATLGREDRAAIAAAVAALANMPRPRRIALARAFLAMSAVAPAAAGEASAEDPQAPPEPG